MNWSSELTGTFRSRASFSASLRVMLRRTRSGCSTAQATIRANGASDPSPCGCGMWRQSISRSPCRSLRLLRCDATPAHRRKNMVATKNAPDSVTAPSPSVTTTAPTSHGPSGLLKDSPRRSQTSRLATVSSCSSGASCSPRAARASLLRLPTWQLDARTTPERRRLGAQAIRMASMRGVPRSRMACGLARRSSSNAAEPRGRLRGFPSQGSRVRAPSSALLASTAAKPQGRGIVY